MFSRELIQSYPEPKQKEILHGLAILINSGLVADQKRGELMTLEAQASDVDDVKLAALIREYRSRITELTQLEELHNELKRIL